MIPYKLFNDKVSETYSKKDYNTKEMVAYSDDILTFDIEVSSGWIIDGKVMGYEKGLKDDYYNEFEPVSLPYVWQFGFNNRFYVGRKIEDFSYILDRLDKSVKHIIYIHNAGYEFEFLANFLEPFKTVFSRHCRKPIYYVSEKYPHIEFRCSYFLTHRSLKSWGEDIGEYKLNTLDYERIRTPYTRLSKKELEYCKQDCNVMYQGLLKYKERYKHVCLIPLTQTGEVRKVVKRKLLRKKNWVRTAIKLLPTNAKEYEQMYKTFAGGYTHANYTLAMRTLYNVKSYDFASSYPAVMCSEKFPMTVFFPKTFKEEYCKDYAYLLKVRFNNIKSKTYHTYISRSKCIEKESSIISVDNGRVLKAEYVTMHLTEQDFFIIKKSYDIGSYEILSSKASRKSYLPKEFIEYVLELYGNKTSLKNIKGKEDLYNVSKQYINSLFGMCVTALCPDDIIFNDGYIIDDPDFKKWEKHIKTLDEIDEYLNELKNEPKGRVFLSYAWGIWITAYARRNIWECLFTIDNGNDKNDCIYIDTDSLKCRGSHDFSWYNIIIDRKLKDMCEYYEIDFELTRPKDKKGIMHPLGHFEVDGDYSEFRTLGAKRYAYRDKKDGTLHITVSGVNKEAVSCLHDDISNFKENFKFDKDDADVKPLYMMYLDNQPSVIWNEGLYDEFKSNYNYGVCSRPKGYSLSIKDIYALLCSVESASQGVFYNETSFL